MCFNEIFPWHKMLYWRMPCAHRSHTLIDFVIKLVRINTWNRMVRYKLFDRWAVYHVACAMSHEPCTEPKQKDYKNSFI